MSQIKKKQHYVWKQYLLPWSNSNQIFALLKSSNKLIKTNIEGVAQERFFYALEEFNDEEEIILNELIKQWTNDNTRPITQEFFHVFTSFSKIKRALRNKDLSNIDVIELEKKLATLKANAMEDIHTTIEKFGEKLIGVRKIDDLQFLEVEHELLSTMIYVSFQYLRTKNMREIIKPYILKRSYLSDKFLNIFPFIYAPGMADSLTYAKKIKFIFFENQTEIDFITSDQPIINAKKHILNEAGNVAQIDFYYPITPKNALIIHYQEQREKYKSVIIEKEDVIYYNDIMFKNAHEFIFSNAEKQLATY